MGRPDTGFQDFVFRYNATREIEVESEGSITDPLTLFVPSTSASVRSADSELPTMGNFS